MRLGLSFLNSKIARRFCVLFLVSAFIPTILLVFLAYKQVVSQLEEQSFSRLKREAESYSQGLFDRMVRIDNDLRIVAANVSAEREQTDPLVAIEEAGGEQLFLAVALYTLNGQVQNISGMIDEDDLQRFLTDDMLQLPKTFVGSIVLEGEPARLFFGVPLTLPDNSRGAVIGEVNPAYIWGVGASPLLPPMTELNVYNQVGDPIMASDNAPVGDYQEISKENIEDDLRLFRYEYQGEVYYGSFSNVFFESRFQRTGWVIFLSQARSDIMSALNAFTTNVPLVVVLFLLVILYLSLNFIRKGLEPLAQLQEGTNRVAAQDYSTKVNITSDDEFEDLGHAFNTMTERIDQQFQTLKLLSEIDKVILSSLGRPKILTSTLWRVKQFFNADIALYIRVTDLSSNYAQMFVQEGRRQTDPEIHYCQLDTASQEKLFVDQPYIVFDEQESIPPLLPDSKGEPYSSFWCLPVQIDGRIERALLFGWRGPKAYDTEGLGRARKIADQLTIALTNSMLFENLEKLAKGTVEALARTVDAKSKWTAGHSERVAEFAAQIGRTMGLGDKDIEILTRGGLLHDIGKIGISLAILDKPDRLTEEEYAEIKTHPQIGAKILEPITAYQDILSVVEQHHEKFDGTGYPYGLAQDEIDLRARILSVADVWDALVSDRPYRGGWVKERAQKLIVDNAGKDFDPVVVSAFLEVIADGQVV